MVKKKIHNTIMAVIDLGLLEFLLKGWVSWGVLIFGNRLLKKKFLIFFLVILITLFNNVTGAPFGLKNQLAFIHPWIIIHSYCLIIFSYTLLSYKKQIIRYLSCALLLGLFLGGWWAFQEFTWGGWWNWDGVESPVFILTVVLTSLGLHANSKHSTSLVNISVKDRFFFIIVILLVTFTRYGSLNSVHAFINASSTYTIYNTWLLGVWSIYKLILVWWYIPVYVLTFFKKLGYIIFILIYYLFLKKKNYIYIS